MIACSRDANSRNLQVLGHSTCNPLILMELRNNRTQHALPELYALWRYFLYGLRDGATEDVLKPKASLLVSGRERMIGFVGRRKIFDKPRGLVAGDSELGARWQRIESDATSPDANITRRRNSIPAELHIWEALKRAKNAAEVRRAFSRSKHWLTDEWKQTFPNGGFVSFPSLTATLYDHADKFCKAKLDSRYPRGHTPRSDDKRIEYLARVLAGLSLRKRMRPSYADKTLRALAPRKPS